MTTSQFIRLLQDTHAAPERYSIIERNYKATLSEEARLISSLDAPLFWDGREVCRLMSLSEIAHAETDLHVAFSQLGLIPFFDRGDNNFVVFVHQSHQWAMFNIHDEVLWHQERTLKKLLPC